MHFLDPAPRTRTAHNPLQRKKACPLREADPSHMHCVGSALGTPALASVPLSRWYSEIRAWARCAPPTVRSRAWTCINLLWSAVGRGMQRQGQSIIREGKGSGTENGA